MISSATRRARYEGMAKPRPILPPLASPELDGTLAPAVGMPTNCPAQLTIAPPLLPGLMAASVWTASTSSADWLSSPGTWIVRSRALTMPLVTVLVSPRGAPSTTTGWPITSLPDSPTGMTRRFFSPLTLITAMSVSGSRPVSCASAVVPSLNLTEMDPPLAAAEMTWLLVRMYPPERMTSPEPVPDPDWPWTLMVTTEGRVSCATGVTRHVCTVVAAPALLLVVDPLDDGELNALTMTPPTTPPPTAATMTAPTRTAVDQDPRRWPSARGGMSPPGCPPRAVPLRCLTYAAARQTRCAAA